MRHLSSITLSAITALAVVSVGHREARADAALAKLSTHLYYYGTGTVDDREASTLSLWNTNIGEGDATGPSSAVFVRATVLGVETLARGSVEMVVTAGKKRIGTQRVSLDDVVSERGKPVVVPFVLHGVGCESLAIRVTVQNGRKTVSQSSVVLPFACAQ